jgi:cytochrome c oxidase cbb3-type subunit 3
MRRHALIIFALALAGAIGARVAAQATPPPPGAPQGTPPPPAGRGQGRAGGETFPAQQRPPADPALVVRGKMLFEVACASCHGADLRGGQLNGPNLLRSQLVLNDQDGELILPIVQGARADKGMPALPIPPDDVKAIATYIHSVLASGRGQGAPPRGSGPPPDVLVGEAAAGEKYFASTCSKCHSVTGDLQSIAARFPDAKSLQNFWVSGGRVGGRGGFGRGGGGGGGGANPRAITATVTLSGNEKVAGRVLRYDDFIITLALTDDTVRSFRRDGDSPKVEIRDPLEPHRALLAVYTNKAMRDVTAYLWTVK